MVFTPYLYWYLRHIFIWCNSIQHLTCLARFMRGLEPRIHVFAALGEKTWMAGTSPAMTGEGNCGTIPAPDSRSRVARDTMKGAAP
jgi:hypothetical protein